MPRPAAARARVLVVDDQLAMAETLADGLVEKGYDAVAIASSRDAAAMLEREPWDALVTDLRMPHVDGLGLLAIAKEAAPERPVIVMTAYSAIDTAIESIRRGAYHYVTKPFKVDELALFLERALADRDLRREAAELRRALRDRGAAPSLIGAGGGLREVQDIVDRVADAAVPVLVTGETGTGKGVVARAIHARGARAAGPFIAVNCAALPETLLESELFGHTKGAFTGATSNRAGLFEQASGGTLLLDEIGEMSPALQAKLLHVLESGRVRAVGATKDRAIDTRVIASTHRDLRAMVAAGTFREDLLYRLDVVTIEIPPLRRRSVDLPALIAHFLHAAKAKHPASPVLAFSAEAERRLLEHRWPGNVRELEHVIERAVILGRSREASASDVPASVAARGDSPAVFHGDVVPMREIVRRYAAWAYEELHGRKLLTAEKLGVDAKTLSKWLAEGHEGDGDEGKGRGR